MGERRTFIAIDLSPAARTVCSQHIDYLRPATREVRVGWERPEKLHITLRFLGLTPDYLIPELENTLGSIVANFSPFTLKLASPGVFPSKAKPRVLWIGVLDASESSARMSSEINRRLEPLGFESEVRKFRPHITIGRVRDVAGVETLTCDHLAAQIEPMDFEVNAIALYESKLQPAGSVYSVLRRFRLR